MKMDIINMALTVLSIAQALCGVVGFATVLLLVIGSTRKVLVVLRRFGLSLYKRKISLVASVETFESLKQDLVSSGLITSENVIHVDGKHLANVKDSLLTIADYGYLGDDEMQRLLHDKQARCGMIVYCAADSKRVGPNTMQALNKEPFTTLCNFRGRLVNDVLLMMLATSFSKKDVASS